MIPALFQVRSPRSSSSRSRSSSTGRSRPSRRPSEAIVAVVWLGLLGSGVAYLCYFTLLQQWGATRTSMVAYLLPVVGIALGAIVLDDPITANRIAGHGRS